MFVIHIFFFKRKTAYEMRISDWSSDVCSSDLLRIVEQGVVGLIVDAVNEGLRIKARLADHRNDLAVARIDRDQRAEEVAHRLLGDELHLGIDRQVQIVTRIAALVFELAQRPAVGRSEEHTSELQSLMRI